MGKTREYKCPACGNYLGSTINSTASMDKVCSNCGKWIHIQVTPAAIYCAVKK